MTGKVISSAGACTIPSTSTTNASSPANGTPAIINNKPRTMAWMNATPRTPNATARMVAVDSFANSSPRPVPKMRSKMALVPLAPDWPKAMMIPAMMKETRNSSIEPPMPATIPSAFLVRSPSFGCRL